MEMIGDEDTVGKIFAWIIIKEKTRQNMLARWVFYIQSELWRNFSLDLMTMVILEFLRDKSFSAAMPFLIL